jgi:acyl carrier protein
VIVDQDEVGDKRLVAFIINGQMPVPSAAEIRRALKDKLPRFMIPSDYVVLEKLPLLPNGKLDRRVLQGLDRPRLGGNNKSYVAPRSAIEHELATLFSEVLKLERIGVHDNFFEQGGHSLLATRTVSRVRQKYGVTLSLRQFFEMPTVEELARLISETQQPQTLPSLPIMPSEVSRAAAPDVSALSDDEVTSMLEALLTEGNDHT